MNRITVIFLLVFTLIVSSSAFAGSWAIGHGRIVGNTPEAAIRAIASTVKLSVIAAEAAIDSDGVGCIGGNLTGGDTRLEVKGDIVKVYTFYSHQAGSCGEISENWIRGQVEELLPNVRL